MGLENLTPQVWAGNILEPLYKNLVFASVVNKDYEGEIKSFGDQVHINEIEDINVGTYSKSSITWQNLDSAQKTLLIDQAKYFAFDIDDIDRAQNKGDVAAKAATRAAYAIRDAVDTFIGLKYSEAGNTVSSATVTAGNVLTNLAAFQLALDEDNVPNGERFFVCPPWYHNYLLQAATGIIGHTGVPKVFSDTMIVNGYVGSLFGFNILVSNNVYYSSTTYYPMAFDRSAISFAGQLTEVQEVMREDYFSKGLKGLYLYGAKVVRPNALATCAATKG
jgi:hypothetical protein